MKTYQEFVVEAQKCWSGYEKKGTKKLFGKTYNNCVKAEDAKDGIYHGHHPKNIMHTKGPNTPTDKPGVHHRAGGAHEVEGKVKDIVSGSRITHRDLLAAAVKKQRQDARRNK